MPRRERLLPVLLPVLLGALLAACTPLTPPSSVAAGLQEPDARRRWVLELFARKPWEPLRRYASDTGGCLGLSSDLTKLLAALELGRLGHPLGRSGEQADRWLVHLAREVRRLNGPRTGPPGPCRDAGGPATLNATVTMGQILLRHRPAEGWSPELREAARAMIRDTHWHRFRPLLTNTAMGGAVGPLVVGEALCDQALWRRGVERTNALFRNVLERGGFEVNALHYSHHHVGVLVAMLDLADPVMREQGRLLLEYELLTGAHLYLPGGGLLPPWSRARQGALRFAEHRERSLGPVMAYFARDPELDLRSFSAAHAGLLHAAATDYTLPEAIRSIFLERRAYTWGARHFRNGAPARAPHLVYPRLAQGGRGATFPWQARVVEGGRAGIGLSHGSHAPANDPVSAGVLVRCDRCDGGWIVLYHGQRFTSEDRDATGAPLLRRPARGPREGHDEGTDFAGQLHGDTLLRVWDPEPGRALPWTEAFLPNWDHPEIGGRKGGWPTPGGWYVGELGGVRVGFRPLGGARAQREDGAPDAAPRGAGCPAARDWDFAPRPGGRAIPGLYHVLCLRGASGSATVVESAGTRSLEAFAAALDARHVAFRADGPGGRAVAEVDAVDDAGARCRLRIEYRPGPGPLPRRYVDCSAPHGTTWPRDAVADDAPPAAGGLDFGLMSSPWVSWDEASRTLRVRKRGFPAHTQRWGDALLAPGEKRPRVCSAAPAPTGGEASPAAAARVPSPGESEASVSPRGPAPRR